MRTEDLEIEKNLNKTMIVQTSTTGTGQRGAGFYVRCPNFQSWYSARWLDFAWCEVERLSRVLGGKKLTGSVTYVTGLSKTACHT